MFYYLFKRILYAVPVLLGVTFAVFLIISLIPGDPATSILGSYATPENVENLNRQLGLDKPFFQRYLIWVVNILQGDFGTSYSLNRPVIDEVVESEKLLNYTVDTMQQWLKLPYQKQIASKLSLRKNVIDIMKKANKDNDEFINAWFSDECRNTMKSIISKLSKK